MRSDEYFRGIDEIKEKLDIIIGLLELRNSIAQARNKLITGQTYYPAQGNQTVICNCDSHKTGESTGGWFCPVHGQHGISGPDIFFCGIGLTTGIPNILFTF